MSPTGQVHCRLIIDVVQRETLIKLLTFLKKQQLILLKQLIRCADDNELGDNKLMILEQTYTSKIQQISIEATKLLKRNYPHLAHRLKMETIQNDVSWKNNRNVSDVSDQ